MASTSASDLRNVARHMCTNEEELRATEIRRVSVGGGAAQPVGMDVVEIRRVDVRKLR